MTISIIQPCFVPWLGYFEQIAIADYFVYMDDVVYTRKDWRNGNQLKSPYGVKNIGFPVKKAPSNTLLNAVEISYTTNWERTLLNQLNEWYKKAAYFENVMDLISPVIMAKPSRLVEFNYKLNNSILAFLGISTPIFFSSDIPRISENKVDRIVEICKNFENVDHLFDGKKAQDFIDPGYFEERGIKVIFQDYQHVQYTQLWGDFIPYMSVIDLMMNVGPKSSEYIITSKLLI